MAKYRKVPVVIEATQWHENGDHPFDFGVLGSVDPMRSEGKVVRYFRHPNRGGAEVCNQCNNEMCCHGWIDTLEGGHTVCPGDWIITGVKGERYPCKPDIFEMTYEEAS